jgi:hypothetical protein
MRGRHLPAAGGVGDQPAALWDAFRFLQMQATDHEDEVS